MTGRAIEAINGLSSKHMVLLSAGMSGGVGMSYFLVEMLKANPSLASKALETVAQWGPLFVLFSIVLWLCDRRFGQLINNQSETSKQMVEAQVKGAVAQQAMADAIALIAKKDDYVTRERELLLNDLTFLVREVKDKVDAIGQRQLAESLTRAQGAGSAG